MEHWAKQFFRKKYLKTCLKHVWTIWEQIWAFLQFWNFLNFLKTFRRLDPPWNTGQEKFPRKVSQNMFKTLLDNLGTILGVFGVLKLFWFFESISKTPPSMEHWAKRNFRRKYPKTCSKHFWIIWERFWAFLEFWNFFDFLKTFRRLDPPWNTRQKKCFEKITPNNVQNTFGHFWERFRAFLEFWSFFDFLKVFRRLHPPWDTGQKEISKESTPKHVQNTFG